MSKFEADETFIKPQESREVLLVKELISQGYEITYGKLTLCDLSKCYRGYQKDRARYQVYCNDFRIMKKDSDDNYQEFNQIYFSLGQAADKFVALKHRLDKDDRVRNSEVPTMPVTL